MNENDFRSALIWQGLVAVAFVYLTRQSVLERLSRVFGRVKVGVVEVEMREIKAQQAKLTSEVKLLRFLISGFVTNFEMAHLEKLAHPERDTYYQRGGSRDEPLMQELIRLCNLDLISKQGIASFRQMPLSGQLRDYAVITPRGRELLALRSEAMETEGSP